jgi:hypothetical protein
MTKTPISSLDNHRDRGAEREEWGPAALAQVPNGNLKGGVLGPTFTQWIFRDRQKLKSVN